MGQDQSHRNYNFLFKHEITYWETLTKEQNNKKRNVTNKYQNDFTIDKNWYFSVTFQKSSTE